MEDVERGTIYRTPGVQIRNRNFIDITRGRASDNCEQTIAVIKKKKKAP